LIERLGYWLDHWNAGLNFADIREAWTRRAGKIGEPITINTLQGTVSGTYQGLTESGALKAEVAGEILEFSHGDVALGGAPALNGDL
jgi:BirA family biotin operon repressor/biotin-[acetyl-CoA-carboxylase] ligase